MYRAKALGKDRFFVYEPSLREENIKRLELIEALRRGMSTELVVHYQPVVDLDRGRVDGYEALVRWDRGTARWYARTPSSRPPRRAG